MGKTKRQPASLKIAYWNANGLYSKKEEVKHFINKHQLDVLLVNETHLKPCQKPNISHYNLYKNDRTTSNGGGTAIYIRNTISHCELPTVDTNLMEITSLQIEMRNGPLILHSVYHPPSNIFNPDEIKNAFKSDIATIMAGDLNAKHVQWNSTCNNPRGSALNKLVQTLPIIIDAPAEHTHLHKPTNTTDVLDIVLLKNVSLNYHLETTIELSSDHHPVLFQLGTGDEEDTFTKTKTNWEKYRDILKNFKIPIIKSANEIDPATIELQNNILQAFNEATKITQKTRKQIDNLPTHIKNLIKEKNAARRTYHRTLNPADKTHLNYMTNRVKEALDLHRNEEWDKKVESLKIQNNSIWQMAKSLKNKTTRNQTALKEGNNIAISEADRANLFAEKMCEQFKPHNLLASTDKQTYENIQKMLTYDDEPPINPVSPEEIVTIIKKLKNKKAPGDDNINNQLLRNLPNKTVMHLTALTNAILRFQKFPEKWKVAKVIMLLKPNKRPSDPISYRPISLLSCTSKIVERCILTRLNEELQTRQVVPHTQFGFRERHSAVQQVTRLSSDIINNLNRKQKTAALFIDLAKGFDKVWHNGLILKMAQQFKLPVKITRLIQSYLTNRKFFVSVNGIKSNNFTIQGGVPQGSVLGPVLFNIYASDIPQMQHAKVAQFADDTALYVTAKFANWATRRLQSDINTLTDWLKVWKFELNTEKSQALFIGPKKRSSARPRHNLKIENKEIPWEKQVKYLGITLDEDMKFSKHVQATKKKANQMLGNLYPLLNPKSKLSLENKITLYKTMILPIILYGIEVYSTTTKQNLYQLQIVQNKTLRICTNAPWFVSNKQIHQDLEMKYIEEIAEERRQKFFKTAELHENPLISDTLNYQANANNKYIHPAQLYKEMDN